jgi:acylphosphatase
MRINLHKNRKGRRYHVSGRVQGVGYRFFACDAAQRHSIGGYVKNLSDGRVEVYEVYAIGDEADLRAFCGDLRRGPRSAAVENVTETDAEVLPQLASHFSMDRD